mgnify:CR=1 FL=1
MYYMSQLYVNLSKAVFYFFGGIMKNHSLDNILGV